MRLQIYLDYSATMPADRRVVDKMVPWLYEHFGSSASRSQLYGWETEKAVEQARGQVAALVGCDPRESVWTSGATESINLALKGAAQFHKAAVEDYRRKHGAEADAPAAAEPGSAGEQKAA